MSDTRGCSRVQKSVQWVYFIEFGEDFEGFEVNKKFRRCGELLQHKATSQRFSDSDDDFCDDDVLQERCK